MEPNKYKIIKEIFSLEGDGTNDDLLNCMMAFEELQDKGYIEQFTNDKGEIDYRVTGRRGTMEILLDKDDTTGVDGQ